MCGFLARRDKICKAGRASSRSAGHCSQPLLKDRPDFLRIGLSNTPRMDRCITLPEYPSGCCPCQSLGSDLRGGLNPKQVKSGCRSGRCSLAAIQGQRLDFPLPWCHACLTIRKSRNFLTQTIFGLFLD